MEWEGSFVHRECTECHVKVLAADGAQGARIHTAFRPDQQLSNMRWKSRLVLRCNKQCQGFHGLAEFVRLPPSCGSAGCGSIRLIILPASGTQNHNADGWPSYSTGACPNTRGRELTRSAGRLCWAASSHELSVPDASQHHMEVRRHPDVLQAEVADALALSQQGGDGNSQLPDHLQCT